MTNLDFRPFVMWLPAWFICEHLLQSNIYNYSEGYYFPMSSETNMQDPYNMI